MYIAFPSVAVRGLYKDSPGHSCKDIRDSGFFQKDREYWIDPEKNGKPIKVYCDMTTDGGKTWSNNDNIKINTLKKVVATFFRYYTQSEKSIE